MPRGPRLDAPGVLHHVMARGLDRQRIFRDDRDREDFLRRLGSLAQVGAWVIYAWALLPNHFHLLVRTGNRPLPKTMRSLLTGYAGVFNRGHGRSGHLFQNRYRSIVVEEEPYFVELIRYLHLNPIRAGIIPHVRSLDRYPYSGHAVLMGTVTYTWQDTATVLRWFANDPRGARRRYREFVADGVEMGRRPELMGGGLLRSAGGWAAVRELRRGREGYAADERILGGIEFVEGLRQEIERTETFRTRVRQKVPDLASLIPRVASIGGVTPEALKGGGRRPAVSRARDGLAYLWVEVLGRSGHQLARELRIRARSVYRAALRGQTAQKRWQRALPG